MLSIPDVFLDYRNQNKKFILEFGEYFEIQNLTKQGLKLTKSYLT